METAEQIEEYLKSNPEATISVVAEGLDISEEEVLQTLDEYQVDDDGNVIHLGPGQGGGWHPARRAEVARVERLKVLIDEQVAERKTILDNLAEDADPDVRQGLEDMVAELERQKAELD